MKPKLSIGLCILISLVLVVFGLVFGTVRGFGDDRAQVTALLKGDNGFLTVMDYRAADGLNLGVVARRHLQNDADVAALESAAKALRTQQPSLASVKIADEKLTDAVNAVAAKLQQTESFRQSARDTAYLDMLSTDLKQLEQNAVISTYNEGALSFNEQLVTTPMGRLAEFFGVTALEIYQ